MEMEKNVSSSVKSTRAETKKKVVDLSKALPKMKERSMKRDWRKIVEINHTPADAKAMLERARMINWIYREDNFRYKIAINDPTFTYSEARRRSRGEYYPILCRSGKTRRERIMEEKLLHEKELAGSPFLAMIARGREAFLPSSLKQDNNNTHVVDHDEVGSLELREKWNGALKLDEDEMTGGDGAVVDNNSQSACSSSSSSAAAVY